MFCPNCGKQIPDNSKFCSECGAKVQKAAGLFHRMEYREQTGQPAKQAERAVPQEAPQPAAAKQSASQPEAERRIQRTAAAAQGDLSDRRKPNFLIIGLIAATFFASLIITIVIFAGSSDDGSALVYLSEGTYGVIRDLESGTGMELVSARTDATTEDLLRFGGDGRTIFFMTRFDGTSGTLNRTNYTKMRMTSSRNEEQVETVAQEVTAFEPYGESGVLYFNENRTLFYSDGGPESIQIAKSVDWFLTDEKGRIVYAVGEGTYTLYGAFLAEPDNRQKLVSGLSASACDALRSRPAGETLNFDHIPYLEKGNLYTAGFDRKPTLLAEHVTLDGPLSEDGAAAFPAPVFFCYVRTDETLVRYDYLAGDPGSKEDEAAKAPLREDYMIPAYEWVTVTNINAQEGEFAQLAASCTLPLAGLEGATMEETARRVGLIAGRTGQLAAEFVSKHAAKADENGLIPVTEDVKADLKKLADASGMRNWLLFCLTQQESGTQLDREAFQKAEDTFKKAQERNRRRAALRKELPLFTLCYFRGGTVQPVLEKVAGCSDCPDGAKLLLTEENYCSWLAGQKFGDLKAEVPSISEADHTAAVLRTGGCYTVAADRIPAGDAQRLYPLENRVFCLDGAGTLFTADAAGKTAGSFAVLAEKADFCGIADGTFYYSANGYTAGGQTWADLFCYTGGTAVCLAREVLADTACMRYEDGSLLGYTGVTGSFDGQPSYELTQFLQDGTAKYVADGVTEYRRIDGRMIVYRSEGDLYLYDGKSHVRLKNAVDTIWISSCLEAKACPPLSGKVWK